MPRLFFGEQAFEELDLAGVVDVVEGYAGDHFAASVFAFWDALIELGFADYSDGLEQRLVFAVQRGYILAPEFFFCGGIEIFGGALEPIAAFFVEAAAGPAEELAADGVFPVGSVNRKFPDVVAAGSRALRGLFGSYARERGAQAWAVPGWAFVGFFESGEESLDFAGHQWLLEWARKIKRPNSVRWTLHASFGK